MAAVAGSDEAGRMVNFLPASNGDHDSRSDLLTWGIQLVAGLGSHWMKGEVSSNFARVHQTLRVTPAIEAGITDHVWSLEEIAGLI